MRNKKGFTLIELLVVIAIIGLLATLAVVALQNARQKSRDAKRVSDIKQLQTALDLFYSDNNSYPAGAATLLGKDGTSDALCGDGFVAAGTPSCTANETYMDRVPADPVNTGTLIYQYTGAATTFGITFELEGATGGLAAGAHTASAAGIQ
jgi:type II secretion system protein G